MKKDDVQNAVTAPGNTTQPRPINLNKTSWKARLIVSLGLIGFSALLLFAWICEFKKLNEAATKEVRVKIDFPENVTLRPGPSTFRYDSKAKELLFSGMLDTSGKEQLEKLLHANSDADSFAFRSKYWSALDELAYLSRQGLQSYLLDLLLLGGLSGLLGVQLRSLTDFVGNACYKGTLDLETWWPWYVVRPCSGFLLGLILVVLIQAGLWQLGALQARDLYWWIGISFLAGFGSQDVTERLRQVSKTLFGGTTGN